MLRIARIFGAVVIGVGLVVGCSSFGSHVTSASPPPALATSRSAAAPAIPDVVRQVFGRSVRGRALVAFRQGPAGAAQRILLIGVVHGNENAGEAIVLQLLRTRTPASTELVVVPDLNPDGVAEHTRQNAHGVDLNRNFPYRWSPLGRRGDLQYSGTKPLSEPEAAAAATLIRRLRPTVTIWFHQPVGVVDESGGALAVEQQFAALLGEPLRRLTRYPGSAPSWQNVTFPGTTAFVVELPRQVGKALGLRALRALRHLEGASG